MKNQPKEEVFGPDIPRTSGGHSRGYPGPKLRSGRSKSWENKHLGADIHDPKARMSTILRDFLRSEKLQNESSPNFSNFRPEFCPEFCSEFSPNFSGTFRASFRGRRRPEKIHQKSPPFFNAKFPGKHEKNIHKILLESRQSKISKNFGQKNFGLNFRCLNIGLISGDPRESLKVMFCLLPCKAK